MIKVLIADDEKHARQRLITLLKKYQLFSPFLEAEDGDQVVRAILTQHPQLIFLDINMPGTPVFNTLRALKEPPLVIFQTAYSQYAVDAFGINALDYLLKPHSPARLCKTVEKIRSALGISTQNPTTAPAEPITALEAAPTGTEAAHQQPPPSGPSPPALPKPSPTPAPFSEPRQISVKSGNVIKVISVKAIRRIVAQSGYSFIYTDQGRLLSDKPLRHYESRLASRQFFRVSRQQIINLALIKAIHPLFKSNFLIELDNGEKVPLSRRRANALRAFLDI